MVRKGFIRTLDAIVAATIILGISAATASYTMLSSSTIGYRSDVLACLNSYVSYLTSTGILQYDIYNNRTDDLIGMLEASGCSPSYGVRVYAVVNSTHIRRVSEYVPLMTTYRMVQFYVPPKADEALGYIVEIYVGERS